MARRSRRHRGRSRRSRSGMSSLRHVRRGFASTKLWNALATLSGVGAVIAQATSADVAYATSTGSWAKWTGSQKLQAVFAWFSSRITNGAWIMPNSLSLGTVKPAWNISSVFNKYLGIGIAALIYRHIPKAPQRTKVGKFAMPLIAAGIIGGLLDQSLSVAGASNVNASYAPRPRVALSSGVNAGL